MGKPIQSRSRTNAKKPCDYPGCQAKRRSVARYCCLHWEKMQNTGHVDGRPVPRILYKHHQKTALRYIESHLDHPQIARALAHIQTTVIDVGRRPNPPYHKPRKLAQLIEQAIWGECHRLQHPSPTLKGNGSTGETVITDRPEPVSAAESLSACVGLYLAYRLNSRILVNDGECLAFALANAVLGLRMYRQVVSWGADGRDAQARMPGARVRRALGEELRSLTYIYSLIAEKIAPFIAETPEQALARKADATRPLPDAEVYVPAEVQREQARARVPSTLTRTPQSSPPNRERVAVAGGGFYWRHLTA